MIPSMRYILPNLVALSNLQEPAVPYDPMLVAPMREELTRNGVAELLTVDEVDGWMGEQSGSALLIINSVCGCAAGQARPAINIALKHSIKPDRIATVFAGQDVEATAQARSHFAEFPPSSPSMALFKNGELVHFLPRHRIESRDAQSIAFELVEAFEAHCGSGDPVGE
jgi:putative YphP/YqiW family bacilliredoxin